MDNDEGLSGLCLYVVTEPRPDVLARLLASVHASSVQPERILILSPDADVFEHIGMRMYSKWLEKQKCYVDIIICDPEKYPGLSARKNLALKIMRRGLYEFALSVDDDMVLDPFCIEELKKAFAQQPELFAAGPSIRQPGNAGIPCNTATMDISIGHVEQDVWHWGGFRQGVKDIPENTPLLVQHLGCSFMHRLQPELLYDENFDRPIYFMHESDFVYGQPAVVVPSAVVHHWPLTGTNMEALRPLYMNDIFMNIRYFAEKHGFGKVNDIDWSAFEAAKRE